MVLQVSREGEMMESVEWYFADSIEKLDVFILAAATLVDELPSLQANDIQQRCEALIGIQEKLSQDKEFFFTLIEFLGPGVLSTTYIGEFQRALDKSILTCDILQSAVVKYRQDIIAASCF
jgi:hypothetical protein